MAHEERTVCMFVVQKQCFSQACLYLTGVESTARKGGTWLMKALQLCVKVVDAPAASLGQS